MGGLHHQGLQRISLLRGSLKTRVGVHSYFRFKPSETMFLSWGGRVWLKFWLSKRKALFSYISEFSKEVLIVLNRQQPVM